MTMGIPWTAIQDMPNDKPYLYQALLQELSKANADLRKAAQV